MRESVVSPDDGPRYRFGVFDFDASTPELRKDGRAVRVRPQSLKLLTLLLAHPGDVLLRDDIQQALWGRDTFIDFEQGVNHCIKELRAALGDAADAPRYIQTLPRRGYRFIAPVERIRHSQWLPLPVSIGEPVASTAQSSAAGELSADASPSSAAAASGSSSGSSRAWVSVGFAAVLATVMIASYAAWSGGRSTPKASALVVLPFSAPEADADLGIGLANAISLRLGGQPLVPVQPMTMGADLSSGQPSRSNGARRAGDTTLVLSGEISRSEADLTVFVRLTDASGAAVWSRPFRARAGELFSIEDVIAERVVAALNLRLAATDQDRLRRRYTNDAAAHQDYLRGRASLVKQTLDGTLEAIQAFEGALQRDPKYALARAGLAMACADMYLRFALASEVERWGSRAETHARTALDLDPDLAEAHLARAAVTRKREFDWNATVDASRRALELNPNLDQAGFFIAAAYYHLGYMEEALIEVEKGRRLNGVDVIEPVRIEALVALFSGNFVSARVHLEEVSRLSSRPVGDTYLALAYYYTGNLERAQTMLESLAGHSSASTAARSGAALASVLAAQGQPGAARLHVDQVLAGSYRDHHVAYSLGAAYAQLGETDQAVRWLRIAADTGFPCLTWFERDPLLEPLRLGPAFPELQRYVRARRESTLSRVG